ALRHPRRRRDRDARAAGLVALLQPEGPGENIPLSPAVDPASVSLGELPDRFRPGALPALLPELGRGYPAGHDRAGGLVQHRRLRFRRVAVSGAGCPLPRPAGDRDDPLPRHPDPDLRSLPEAGLARHLPAVDRADLAGRLALLHLPAAAVLPAPVAGTRRRG